VAQPIKASTTLCWAISIQAEDTNALKLYIGNDGSDSVDADSGAWLVPGGAVDYNASTMFSAYTDYIDLSSIYVYSDETAVFRITYWVGISGD